MSTARTLITAEEFMQMSFDHPVELVRGEVVHSSPPKKPHGMVITNIAYALTHWAMPERLRRAPSGDTEFRTGPDSVRGVDVSFYLREKVDRGALDADSDIPPDLCVEVLSPSNTWSEIAEKIDEYLAAGAAEVWIADPDLQSIQVYRSDVAHRTVHSDETLTSELLPGFEASVADLFDRT